MGMRQAVLEEGELSVDPRHIKMIAEKAVPTVVDAFIELITNSNDAYRNCPPSYEHRDGDIVIEILRKKSPASSVVTFFDKAGGLLLSESCIKILRYGGHNAYDQSRGFMGRGAKDVAVAGDVTYRAIKNGQVSEVVITKDFTTKKWDAPLTAKANDYFELGIRPGQGGMKVTIEFPRNPRKQYQLPQMKTLVRDLERSPQLRDIINTRRVVIKDLSRKRRYDRPYVLTYKAPEGTKVLDTQVAFSGPFTGVTASLILYVSPTPIPVDHNEGVVVADEYAVHQVTYFGDDLAQNSIARRVFGRLQCNYIRDLQIEYERCRRDRMSPPEYNNTDIVDPNRRRGLDPNHHFVKILFEWAEQQVRSVVEALKTSIDEVRPKDITSKEMKKRFKKVGKFIASFFEQNMDEDTLLPKSVEDESILARDGVILNPRFQKLQVGERRKMGYTIPCLPELENTRLTITSSSEHLIVTPDSPLLIPQKRNPERCTAYFYLEGIALDSDCKLTIETERSDLVAPLIRSIEIVEAEKPYVDFPYGLMFKQRTNTVHPEGFKNLIFIAKGIEFQDVGKSSFTVLSENTEAVAVSSVYKLESISKEVMIGYVKIRGKEVDATSVITLSVQTANGLQTAQTLVQVNRSDETETVVEPPIFEISPEPWDGNRRAMWDRDRPNVLRIFAEHPVNKRYLGSIEDNWPGQNSPIWMGILAEILVEKVIEKIMINKTATNPEFFQNPKQVILSENQWREEIQLSIHEMIAPNSLME